MHGFSQYEYQTHYRSIENLYANAITTVGGGELKVNNLKEIVTVSKRLRQFVFLENSFEDTERVFKMVRLLKTVISAFENYTEIDTKGANDSVKATEEYFTEQLRGQFLTMVSYWSKMEPADFQHFFAMSWNLEVFDKMRQESSKILSTPAYPVTSSQVWLASDKTKYLTLLKRKDPKKLFVEKFTAALCGHFREDKEIFTIEGQKYADAVFGTKMAAVIFDSSYQHPVVELLLRTGDAKVYPGGLHSVIVADTAFMMIALSQLLRNSFGPVKPTEPVIVRDEREEIWETAASLWLSSKPSDVTYDLKVAFETASAM